MVFMALIIHTIGKKTHCHRNMYIFQIMRFRWTHWCSFHIFDFKNVTLRAGYKSGTVCFLAEISRLSLHRSEWGSWVEIPTLLSSQVKMCESDWFHTGMSATGTIFPTFFTKKMILKKWKLWEIEQVKDISALAMMCKIWKMMCKIWKKHPKCKLQYRENCGRYRNDLLDQ